MIQILFYFSVAWYYTTISWQISNCRDCKDYSYYIFNYFIITKKFKDMPGFGRSTLPDSFFSIRAESEIINKYCEFYSKIMDNLNISQPYGKYTFYITINQLINESYNILMFNHLSDSCGSFLRRFYVYPLCFSIPSSHIEAITSWCPRILPYKW